MGPMGNIIYGLLFDGCLALWIMGLLLRQQS